MTVFKEILILIKYAVYLWRALLQKGFKSIFLNIYANCVGFIRRTVAENKLNVKDGDSE